MKYSCFIVSFLFLSNALYAQLRYPIVGRFNKKTAQGMAIYGDMAFLMNDGGGCRQLNLKTGHIEKQFRLESSKENPHVNNACFGAEKIKSSQFPFVYISECRKGKYRCFVENLDSTGHLVQTIVAKNGEKMVPIYTWVVDVNNHALYGITKRGNRNSITKYRLPKISEGVNVLLTDNDVLDKYEVFFPNVLQGASIKDNYLYIATGYQQSLSDKPDSQRAIQIIDLVKKKLVKTIDLTYLTTNEPEGIGFYKDKCLLFCSQEGGVYEVNIK